MTRMETLLQIALMALENMEWAINALEEELGEELDGTLEALDAMLGPRSHTPPQVNAQILEQFLRRTRTQEGTDHDQTATF
jgi:uncharacterized membrane protein YccC